MKKKERRSFNFYRSYFDTIEDASPKDQLAVLLAIIRKQFFNEEPELTGIAKLLYNAQKLSIEEQVQGAINRGKREGYNPFYTPPGAGGRAGGSPGAGAEEEVEVERELEVEVQLKENLLNNKGDKGVLKHSPSKRLSLEERKSAFAEQVKSQIGKQTTNGEFTVEHAREFFLYWSEHSDGAKKMRYERQDAFSLGRRVATWMSVAKSRNNDRSKDAPPVRMTTIIPKI